MQTSGPIPWPRLERHRLCQFSDCSLIELKLLQVLASLRGHYCSAFFYYPFEPILFERRHSDIMNVLNYSHISLKSAMVEIHG